MKTNQEDVMDWVRLKYDVKPNQLVCERCGEIQSLPEGCIRLSMLDAIMKAFMAIHQHCKER